MCSTNTRRPEARQGTRPPDRRLAPINVNTTPASLAYKLLPMQASEVWATEQPDVSRRAAQAMQSASLTPNQRFQIAHAVEAVDSREELTADICGELEAAENGALLRVDQSKISAEIGRRLDADRRE